ncbi:MAG TPA: hypothetical protein DCX07_13485 [Phycisphaerales bacterium]|nr:hypothetical protein [Phycisphaerales bacterium]
MRKTLTVAIVTLAALAGGCKPKEMTSRAINTMTADGLEVSIELPKRDFRSGESFNVIVTARNISGGPLAIEASSAAPVWLRLHRHGAIGYDEIRRYPEAVAMVLSTWTLAPKQARTFTYRLTVEPDWPRHELLHLTAEVNGRASAAPGIAILVLP